MATLYIIGNGFDLAHGLPTRFSDLKASLGSYQNRPFFAQMKCFYPALRNDKGYCWSNLESALAVPDLDQILHSCFWHMYNTKNTYEEEQELCYNKYFSFIDTLRTGISQWMYSINDRLKDKNQLDCFHFTKDDYFLTFNYTATLEVVYSNDITKNHILHIHGKVEQLYSNNLVFGFGAQFKPENIPTNLTSYETKCLQKIMGFAANLKKPVREIIKDNEDFFSELKNAEIDHVVVWGHSLGIADYPYFDVVSKSLGNKTNWTFSAYNKDDIRNILSFAQKHKYAGKESVEIVYKGKLININVNSRII